MRIIFLCLVFLIDAYGANLIEPIPLHVKYDKQKALLGKKLFFDKILSYDRRVSCESCHDLKDTFSGSDNKEVSLGVGGQKGTRNSPTVLNAIFNTFQFWDGSAQNLKEQAYGPIHNPKEMGMSDKLVLLRLNRNKEYKKAFAMLYKDGISVDNVVDAIAEFEKTLTTPNSAFDKFLRGDKNALNEVQKRGYKKFIKFGCISCHNGINMGGNNMQIFGIYDKSHQDGKSNKYKLHEPLYIKIPTLRNISKTAPYFHDGKGKNLKQTIDTMVHYQLGKNISKKDRDDLYNFLLTLDGERPKFLDETN